MIFEPKWKSLLANTVEPIFTPQQCQDIINVGHQQKASKEEDTTLKCALQPSAGFLLQ